MDKTTAYSGLQAEYRILPLQQGLCRLMGNRAEMGADAALLDRLQQRTSARGGDDPEMGINPQNSWILAEEYVQCLPLLKEIWKLLENRPRVVLAIDGRCGSGKTTLAQTVQSALGGRVLHMDDYYLPPDRRDKNWMTQPAGNIDRARFVQEVLMPASAGKEICAVAYSCRLGAYQPPVRLAAEPLTLIEGSYSHHPELTSWYDRRIFLTCTPAVQQARLQHREGDRWEQFRTRWIPLEEQYFARYAIPDRADRVVDTSGFVWGNTP